MMLTGLAAGPVAQAQIVQQYYLPSPENQVLAALRGIYTQSRCNSNSADPVDPISSYASVSILASGTLIYYDHWEDGFEANAAVRTQSTTQIWGDGNSANGAPPGVPSDVLNAGTVIVLNNNVQSTTRQSVIDYDGGDRVSATKPIAMSRAVWATGSSTLHAGAMEMYPTQRWGREYIVPVGENTYTTSHDPFEYTAGMIMAQANNTTVQIDADANGSFESSTTLARGASHLVSGLQRGARISASSDVQVTLITGDICDTYESRWYSLFPSTAWSNTYYTPVGSPTATGKRATLVFFYNPGNSSLTINIKTRTSTASVSVPAKGNATYTMPTNSGARFSASSNFYALTNQDHYASSNSSDNDGSAHDCGFTLIPQSALSQQVLVGLGLGKDPTSSLTGNHSPVWLAADLICGSNPVDGLIRVYVDYDNNGTDSGSPKIDPLTGRQYDVVYNLAPLQSQIVSDPDGDQTGMFAWISDPNAADQACAVLVAAWTQNPNTAPGGAPALDVSTTVPSAPVAEIQKSSAIVFDRNGDEALNNGDQIDYTIAIYNAGLIPLAGAKVVDDFPFSQLSYVAGSTRLDMADGSAPIVIADNGGANTPFPLDGTGHTLSQNIPVGDTVYITFRATVANAPSAPAEICNLATVTVGLFSTSDQDCLPASPNTAVVGDLAWNDLNRNGVQDGGEPGFANVEVRLYTAAGVPVGSAVTTPSSGAYLFDQLAPGSYYLSYTPLAAGYTFTVQGAGGNAAADSDVVVATGRTANFNLAQDQTDLTRDAGLVCLPIVLNCPPNRVLDCVNPNTSTAANGVATATSPCGCVISVSHSDSSAPACPSSNFAYVITRTWTAQDQCGNTATCVQTITVRDLTAPVLANVGGPLSRACNGNLSFSNPTATDNCDNAPVITFADTTTAGSCPQSYLLTRTWTATDRCGNLSTASQTITVTDTVAPTISGVGSNASRPCSVGLFSNPTATDNCDPAPTLTFQDTITPGSCPFSFVHTRTWTATDKCGNARTASQTITVVDSNAPVLTGVPANTTVDCPSIPAPPTVTASDACAGSRPVTFSSATTPGTCPQSYTLTRTWSATDTCGNTATQSQVITVRDVVPPVISSLPAPSTIACPATPSFATPTAADACDPNPLLTFADTTTPGACAQSYVRVRTWTATDACGNSAQASQSVTVQDTTAPALSALPPPAELNCPATPNFATPVATDDCDANPVLSHADATTPGACAQSYTLTRTWTATDACGNARTSSQVFQVRDTLAPVISGVGPAGALQCGQAMVFSSPTAADTCDPNPSLTFADVTTPGACPQSFVVTRTWTATDACGNSSQASQSVTVSDPNPPVISGVGGAVTRQCSGNLAFSSPSASDACDPSPSLTFVTVTTPGACPQSYVMTRTWTATDACGNTAQASQVITVQDTVAPQFSGVGSNGTRQCNVGLFSNPTANDNCDPAPSLVFVDTLVPGPCPQSFQQTRTWTATDACGNVRTASQTITVVDTIAPVISGVGANFAVNCDQTPVFSDPTASDNCAGSVALTFVDVDVPIFGACDLNYERTRTWTALDPCGNSATASQTITVRDTSGDICYALADGGQTGGSGNGSARDLLVKIDKFTGDTTQIGYPSSYNGESLAYWPPNQRLYTFDGNKLIWINPETGSSSQIGPSSSQTMQGSLGGITINDIDGLTFDATVSPPILYASHRRGSSGQNDLLLMVNTNNGRFVANAFGPGKDYQVVQNLTKSTSSGTRVLHDVDDLAHDPSTGNLYAILNNSGDEDNLVIIDPATGNITNVGELTVDDAEGLSFFIDGALFASTGSAGPSSTNNRLFDIDKAVGEASNPRAISYGEDYEGVTCFTGRNALVGDRVWHDINANGIQDDGEPGLAGVTVSIYRTFDNTVVQTKQTDAQGNYSFVVVPAEYFLEFVLPEGFVFTTRQAPGSTDSNDSDADAATGRTSAFRLSLFASDFTRDAGMRCLNPVLVLPADQVVNCPDDTTVLTTGQATATSPCGCPLAVTYTDTVLPACGNTQVIHRDWSATDECGNTTVGRQTITRVDLTAPVLAGVPGVATVQCSNIPAVAVVTASDACDGPIPVVFSSATVPGACPGTYTLVRTWTATDACGNAASASQTINVRDTAPPTFTGVGSNGTRQCNVGLFSNPSASDNCDPAPVVSHVDNVVPGACPQSFVHTRTWTATDHCGNTRTASQTITVVDTISPVLAGVPGPATVACDAVPAPAVVTATDSCDVSPVVTLAAVPTAGPCAQSYTLTRTWTATDACGNASSASQVLTVVDTVAPVISGVGPSATVDCTTANPYSSPTAADACDPSPALSFADAVAPGACPQNFTVTRTWTAIDACGNVRTASQAITFVDTTAPVISGVGAAQTVECGQPVVFSTPSVTDNCDAAPALVFQDNVSAGVCPAITVHTRTWTATDACGNMSTASQTITVQDTLAPVLSGVGGPFTRQCSGNLAFSEPTASDACDPLPTLTHVTVTTPGACPQSYTLTRTWTATDACGNTSSASQVITVQDTVAPQFTGVGSNGTRQCNVGLFSNPSITDNCDPSPVLSSADTVTPGACPQSFTHTRTWTATDACGNVRTASQSITVVDTLAPVISGVGPDSVIDCSESVVFSDSVTVSDSCDTAPTLSFLDSTVPGPCPQNFQRVRTWTARDACGNVSTATQRVTVQDTTPPEIAIVFPATLDGDANCQALVPALTVFAFDDCASNLVVTQNPPAGTLVGQGTHPVTVTVSDGCGNAASQVSSVTVECVAPGIKILKSVYLGHDGGASCPGLETVHGVPGTPVTYCFLVVNDGAQTLTDVTITDPSIGMDPIVVGTLFSENSVTRFAEATLTADLLNVATVQGTPASGPAVIDTDTAFVDAIAPSIDLQKTVAAGGSTDCPGLESRTANNGAAITYCFVVTNTGDSPLAGVTLVDPALQMPSLPLGWLASGQSVTTAVQSVVMGSLTNLAEVSAYPPMGPAVSDTDTAVVQASGAGLRLDKTVYAGHDGGSGCEGAENLAVAANSPVTYCFRVTNVGDATLSAVNVDDPTIGLVAAAGALAPGQSATLYAEVTLTGFVTNTAVATGAVLGGGEVTAQDSATAGPYAAGLTLDKRLFEGHGDPATGCATAVDLVTAPLGDLVTYCFKVTNTGNTHLNDIRVEDLDLGLSEAAMNFVSGEFPLPPGGSAVFSYAAAVQGSLINRAVASGQPVTEEGRDITGLSRPQHQDTAELQAVGEILDQN
jgi:uncharacterized repeat protein (TIGR01451 family)